MTKWSTLIARCGLKTVPPLQHTSCHPAHIHKSWPVSMVRRLEDLSTERFVRHLASPELISRLRETSTSQTKTSRSTERPSGDRMWVTFPFHPVRTKHFAKAIRNFLNDDNWNAILSQGFEVHQKLLDKIRSAQIAKCNYLQPHVFQIQNPSKATRIPSMHEVNLLFPPCTFC